MPCAIVGARLWDVTGVFVGMAVASNVAGIVALAYGSICMTPTRLAESRERRNGKPPGATVMARP